MATHGSSAMPDQMDMAPRPSTSSSQGAVANPGEEDKEKPRLTDKEKKANHIASEKKRRHAIRHGFDRISNIVPGLQGHARSEGLVLEATLDYLRSLMLERRALIESLEAAGVPVDQAVKESLESLPPGWLDGGGSQASGSVSGTPEVDNERQDAEGSSGSSDSSDSGGSVRAGFHSIAKNSSAKAE